MAIVDLGAMAAAAKDVFSDRPIFTLWISGTALRVVRFTGREVVSGPFELRVEIVGEVEDPEALLGRPARLQLTSVEAPRSFHGIVCEVEYVGSTRSHDLYELTIAPWAHYLHHRAGIRLFQDKTTEQIITDVLTRAGLPRSWFRFSLVGSYAPRNYCVQYRETDLAFVSRLLEEDGIFYFFEHEEEKHVWVMADHSEAHPPIAGTPVVWFRPPLGAMIQDREHIEDFRFGGRILANKVTLRDFNLHKPDDKLEAEAASSAAVVLEEYDYPGGYQTSGRAGPHQGGELANIRLEALQATRRAGRGKSDCPRLVAGSVMELSGHPRVELNVQYRLISVTHTGAQPQVLDQGAGGASEYRNSFTCTELTAPFRPARVTPRPTVGGLQTATVVGPESEEIHTDEFGRVRVQFHWDREGPHNETSTCWLRVSQAWAGNGWGAVFLPRIGHEVLVDFIEGDPDRPIVTGRVYHGYNRPPYALPDNKTQSGVKSESSPGGGGSNELRFEDAKGREEVYVHAQKDLTEKVENNHGTTVGVNHSNSVGSNQSNSVGGNQSNSVGGNQSNTVGGDQTESVTGKQTMTVDRNRKVTVTGSQSVQVLGGAAEDGVTGAKLDIVGDYKLDASAKIDIQAPTHIKLTCGGSSITIEPAKISIEAGGKGRLVLDVEALLESAAKSSVKLDADAKAKASTGGELKLTADVLAKATSGSQLLLDANATMSSPAVALVQGPTAAIAAAGGMVEATGAGVTCAGGQINVSGGEVNIAGGMVKIN